MHYADDVIQHNELDYISLTDMLKAKDGDFISDWLRNRNTIEFLGIWERVYNPDFNFMANLLQLKSQSGLIITRLAQRRVEN